MHLPKNKNTKRNDWQLRVRQQGNSDEVHEFPFGRSCGLPAFDEPASSRIRLLCCQHGFDLVAVLRPLSFIRRAMPRVEATDEEGIEIPIKAGRGRP